MNRIELRLETEREPIDESARERVKERTAKRIRENERLEQEADELLRTLPSDPDCPVSTEANLFRPERGGRFGRTVASVDALAETLPSNRASQCWQEEIEFLATISTLTSYEALCLRGWTQGLTQAEMSEKFKLHSQQLVSRSLKKAVWKCFQGLDATFTSVSKHVFYKKPIRRGLNYSGRRCRNCSEPFARYLGFGLFCSAGCREAIGHRKRWGE